MNLEIFSSNPKESSAVSLSDSFIDSPYNESLIHQVVTSCMSNRRQGTHQQKTRAEVSGGGIKPWKQKGSGRARAGTIRGPLWRHGGRAFAARPGVYSQKINKKMYRLAICSILSQLRRDNRLIVVDKININEPKTKLLNLYLKNLNLDSSLIILDELNNVVTLAARNLINTHVITSSNIDPVSLISYQNVVITRKALEQLNEVFKNDQ